MQCRPTETAHKPVLFWVNGAFTHTDQRCHCVLKPIIPVFCCATTVCSFIEPGHVRRVLRSATLQVCSDQRSYGLNIARCTLWLIFTQAIESKAVTEVKIRGKANVICWPCFPKCSLDLKVPSTQSVFFLFLSYVSGIEIYIYFNHDSWNWQNLWQM